MSKNIKKAHIIKSDECSEIEKNIEVLISTIEGAKTTIEINEAKLKLAHEIQLLRFEMNTYFDLVANAVK